MEREVVVTRRYGLGDVIVDAFKAAWVVIAFLLWVVLYVVRIVRAMRPRQEHAERPQEPPNDVWRYGYH